jgi:hypothetical protein
MSKLPAFVRSLPSAWATCPIYAKGVKLPSGKEACGKSPLGKTHHEDWSPAETALHIERNPEEFKAVGVFTGPRSNGLVILDIDANLAQLKKKWGQDLKAAPVVKSAKKNAAKYLFYVPREYWGEVDGLSLSASKEGWEVLWGRQGLVGGDYKDQGVYTQEGDFEAIPEAPEWLLAYMKESFRGKQKADEGKKDPRYGMRSTEELCLIVKNCLSVVQPQGRGSEDQWWRIGAMIHSELPGDEGLDLWREWSRRDDEYAEDWEQNDPCADRWDSGFKSGGGLGLGSLISLADHYDPDRNRFVNNPAVKQVLDEINLLPQNWRQIYPSFEKSIEELEKIFSTKNPAEKEYKMEMLRNECNLRDTAKLTSIYAKNLAYENNKSEITYSELLKTDLTKEYLIPDVLPFPAVVLIYGAGGDGKSMSAWALAKHIALGNPFVVKGRPVPVQQGPVLILNGDQPKVSLKEQLLAMDFPETSNLIIKSEFDITNLPEFKDLVEKYRPKLVVIDSLIGCSVGAFDENKSEFANPLYELTRGNGSNFPATTIVVIHHANKTGGFRGTSAIRDAVDETWALKKPSKEQVEKGNAPGHSRLITIEKSRSGRSGTCLAMRMEDDLSFSISDFTPEVDQSNTSPSSIGDRILQRLRVIHPRTATKTDLNADPLVGGKVLAIQKALQRLVQSGLVEIAGTTPTKKGGRPTNQYKAVLARGEREEVVHLPKNPSLGTDLQLDNSQLDKGLSNCSATKAASAQSNETSPENKEACPIADPSAGADSEVNGQGFVYPPAREEERTKDELNASRDKAWDMWSVQSDT